MNRRNLLKIAAGGTGLIMAGKTVAQETCAVPTKEQTEGPFYPEDWNRFEADADMTKIAGKSEAALGQLALITGTLIDHRTCAPIANAQVDIWQANKFGQYYHKNDASEAELKDKNFQYRCRVITDEKGNFSFKTIKPSPYPAGGNWVRPPHIHYKVLAEGYQELNTQMYFEGEPLNKLDRILNNMSTAEQDGVIVSFKESNSRILEGHFTVSIIAK